MKVRPTVQKHVNSACAHICWNFDTTNADTGYTCVRNATNESRMKIKLELVGVSAEQNIEIN